MNDYFWRYVAWYFGVPVLLVIAANVVAWGLIWVVKKIAGRRKGGK